MTDKSMFAVLSDVQERIEQPKLNAAVNYGNMRFRYADLGELWRVVRAATKGTGLFIHHTEENGCICVMAHLGDQSAELSRCPANLTGKPQDVGSALTYAKRYSLAMAFGLVAEDDDDGQRGAGQIVEPKGKELEAAAHELANACAVYAGATGRALDEVKREAASRKDFKKDDPETYRRIAKELIEAVE